MLFIINITAAKAVDREFVYIDFFPPLPPLPLLSPRFFKGLNMDGLTGIKEPKKVKVAKEDDNVTEGEEQPQVIGRRTVIQLYADRMTLPCQNEQLIAALPQMNLLRFSSEVDMQGMDAPGVSGSFGRFRERFGDDFGATLCVKSQMKHGQFLSATSTDIHLAFFAPSSHI